MSLSRRHILGCGAAATAFAMSLGNQAEAARVSFAIDDPDWVSFKNRFVSADGRVIDTGNNDISHSEGQSYGMLFAVVFGDQASFDLIKGWTATNLTRQTDALHIWRYLPKQKNPTPDDNNATDGDLVIAMALSRAATLWGRPEDASQARAIAQAIREKLIMNAGSRLVLLPGVNGFVRKTQLISNLSYSNFVAFRELSVIDPSPLWQVLGLDALALIEAARFGQWQLPPDWLALPLHGGDPVVATGWPPRCSYDAIRVPLNLVWSQNLPAAVATSFENFWSTAASYQPAWADLKTNAVSTYAAAGGLVAVRQITSATSPQLGLPALPQVQQCTDYYSSALTLLSRIAWAEGHGIG
ncbi:hypothetical protein ACELLULO517_24700 [Acidisoma cellulosilytica]|uniref:cellulase n=1 Tax=Acidisoma cellulosilyticum TaxID=2802395 RepID=A0A964E6E2_9PROT|nr:glycosyl hydrolase family 8 [Acidisoma cellulosilyticum]MCB8883471.1 hypothetical protein [Acidisoma cellulosilyticum]